MLEIYNNSRRLVVPEDVMDKIYGLLNFEVHTAKVCPRCEKRLSRRAFNKHKSRPDGLQPYCRDCTRLYRTPRYKTARQANNAGIGLAITEEYRREQKGYTVEIGTLRTPQELCPEMFNEAGELIAEPAKPFKPIRFNAETHQWEDQ